MSNVKPISIEEKLAYSVDEFPMSVRASNILKRQGVKTVQDLVNLDAKVLLATEGCGKKTIVELLACLKMLNLKMPNSDRMFPDAVIDEHVASIRSHLAQLREPKPKVETYHDKRAKDIKLKQLAVMLMRVNGAAFSSIAKEIGRAEGTTRVYFTRYSRALVREAEKRRIPITEILTEKNIPLAAIELMKKDGIRMLTCDA